MEFAELVIVFAVTITLSNIASRILPMIPAPLIQIFLGIVLGLTKWGQSINFEPELFLVMIIAPLLFREGEKADISSILKNFDFVFSFRWCDFDTGRSWSDLIFSITKCPDCRLFCFWRSTRSDRCCSSQFIVWTSKYP